MYPNAYFAQPYEPAPKDPPRATWLLIKIAFVLLVGSIIWSTMTIWSPNKSNGIPVLVLIGSVEAVGCFIVWLVSVAIHDIMFKLVLMTKGMSPRKLVIRVTWLHGVFYMYTMVNLAAVTYLSGNSVQDKYFFAAWWLPLSAAIVLGLLTEADNRLLDISRGVETVSLPMR